MNKLLECYVVPKKVALRVSGDFEIKSVSGVKTYGISNLNLEKIESDDTTIPYEAGGTNDAGIKYKKTDVVNNLITTLINNPRTKNIEYSYVSPSVQEFVNIYKKTAVKNGEIEIPEMLFIEPYNPPYILNFATNYNAYYRNANGDMVMTRIMDGEIIANIDEFIENGLYSTIRNIIKGTENVLYGDYQQIQKDMNIEIDEYDLD